MSPGATFERVYLALREKILSGAFPPGAQLEPSALSTDLMASITPVRDALHRLAGERLVSTPRADGFRMPIYTEAGLRDLYLWNWRVLNLALASRQLVASEPTAEAFDSADRTASLFAAIGRMAGSGELSAALAGMNDRLHAVRHREAELVDPEDELREIAELLSSGSWMELRRRLGRYHRRRIGDVVRLLEKLQPSL